MKRIFPLLLAALLAFALALPALADVAYTPNNDFFNKHMDQCRYENRSYYVNGADGLVMACDIPVGNPIAALPNGNLFYVSYVFTAGDDDWGCIEFDPDTLENKPWQGTSGWVKMSDMVPDYDYIAFDADHQSEYRYEERELKVLRSSGESVQLYKYPGSGIVVGSIESSWLERPITFSTLFTDPAGRTWGFLGYLYGRHNAWVCLDDPFNAALAADENAVTLRFVTGSDTSPETSTIDDTKTLDITAPASDEALAAAAKSVKRSGFSSLAGAGGVIVIALAVLIEVMRRRQMKRF